MSILEIPEGTASLIHDYRTRKGWSIRELGRQVGVSHTAVRNWESGDDVSAENLRKVAEALDIPAEALGRALLTGRRGETPWSLHTPSHLGKRRRSFALAGAVA